MFCKKKSEDNVEDRSRFDCPFKLLLLLFLIY